MFGAADNLAALILHEVFLLKTTRRLLGDATPNFLLGANRFHCTTGYHLFRVGPCDVRYLEKFFVKTQLKIRLRL